MLQKQIQAKDSPSKVAESRLLKRSGRPRIESCNDKANQALVNEVHELHESSKALNIELDNTMKNMDSLKATKKTLEEDIRIKTYSILIDKMKCMTQLRRTFPFKVKTSRILTF